MASEAEHCYSKTSMDSLVLRYNTSTIDVGQSTIKHWKSNIQLYTHPLFPH